MQETLNQVNKGTIVSQYTAGNIPENSETRQIPEEKAALVYADDSQLSLELPEIPEISEIVEIPDDPEPDYPEYSNTYKHVRSPEIRRSEQVILMSAAAVCGAVGGVLLALSGKAADPEVLQKLADNTLSGFGSIFLQRVMLGALFLGIEYLLGFFAFGDLLVWTAPLVYSLGTAFRITALKSWILLPSAIVGTVAVVLGAALSSGFSYALMRLSSGGTVYLESSPKQKLAVSFLGCLAAVIAAAIYEGAIL